MSNKEPDVVNDNVPSIDALKSAFSEIPAGVAAVGVVNQEGEPDAMIVSTATPVSLSPPLISICMDKKSKTWQRMKGASCNGINILGSTSVDDLTSLRNPNYLDRFKSVKWRKTSSGSLMLDNYAIHLDCKVHDTVDAGDHDLLLLRIVELSQNETNTSLFYHRRSILPLD